MKKVFTSFWLTIILLCNTCSPVNDSSFPKQCPQKVRDSLQKIMRLCKDKTSRFCAQTKELSCALRNGLKNDLHRIHSWAQQQIQHFKNHPLEDSFNGVILALLIITIYNNPEQTKELYYALGSLYTLQALSNL